MIMDLPSCGRPSKTQHSGEPCKPFAPTPENIANSPRSNRATGLFLLPLYDNRYKWIEPSERLSYLVPNLFLRYDSTVAASFAERTRLKTRISLISPLKKV